jgi:hypothetical protein
LIRLHKATQILPKQIVSGDASREIEAFDGSSSPKKAKTASYASKRKECMTPTTGFQLAAKEKEKCPWKCNCLPILNDKKGRRFHNKLCKYQIWHDAILINSRRSAENKIDLPTPNDGEIVHPIHKALSAGVRSMKYCVPVSQRDIDDIPKAYWEYMI